MQYDAANRNGCATVFHSSNSTVVRPYDSTIVTQSWRTASLLVSTKVQVVEVGKSPLLDLPRPLQQALQQMQLLALLSQLLLAASQLCPASLPVSRSSAVVLQCSDSV
jgi:hypothetical protein